MNPPALEAKPIIHDWMKLYLEGFDLLSNTRPVGMGPGPIPLSEILAYISFYDVEDPLVFVKYIRLMDVTYLNWHESQAEKERQNGK